MIVSLRRSEWWPSRISRPLGWLTNARNAPKNETTADRRVCKVASSIPKHFRQGVPPVYCMGMLDASIGGSASKIGAKFAFASSFQAADIYIYIGTFCATNPEAVRGLRPRTAKMLMSLDMDESLYIGVLDHGEFISECFSPIPAQQGSEVTPMTAHWARSVQLRSTRRRPRVALAGAVRRSSPSTRK